MDWPAACAAVIPCRNEQATIGPLVRAITERLPTVFVIDDASADDTVPQARNAGAIVLENQAGQGKGAALQTGWTYARKYAFRWAISMDGDGQHSPDDIPAFLECAERQSAALVCGNRMSQASRMPCLRRWVNRWMSRRLSRLTGQCLPDSQCGFRLMDLDDWARLPPLETRHFEIESEVLVLFAQACLPIQFVPIAAVYQDEQSKIHPWNDTLRWLRWYAGVRRRNTGG
jgi:glycosyltransferase involved in cell wall biosynthesis